MVLGLAYGSVGSHAKARQYTPAFLVRWGDANQTLYYHDTSVTMDQFRALTHKTVKIASSLCAELMYSWTPHADLHRMKDGLTNRKFGFSFVHHPGNHLSEGYLELNTRATQRTINLGFGEG